jgi:photosystem II stability/assembly factor-like uncharacterized protein
MVAVTAPSSARDDATLNDVHFHDAAHAWAVGNLGTILHSTDGGETWVRQTSGTDACLQSVYFIDHERGFAAGGNAQGVGVLLTTADGGETWEKVSNPHAGWLYDVWFDDARKGWLAGEATSTAPSGLQFTVNGVGRFQPLSGATTGTMRSAAFSHFGKGVAVGQDGDVVTLRGVGVANFGRAVDHHGALHGAAYVGTSRICLVGDDGAVFLSVDAGRNWQAVTSPVRPGLRDVVDLQSVCFADPDQAWAVGRIGGYLLHSVDGGATWQVRLLGASTGGAGLRSVHFADPQTGAAVGVLGRIHITHDGGATWRVVRNESLGLAALVVTADPSRTAWPLLAHLYGRNGWRCGLVSVAGSASAATLRQAANIVGCAVVDSLNEFTPFPSPTDTTTRQAVLDHWSTRLDRDAADSLRRQLTAVIRSLKPAVVIVDSRTIDTGRYAATSVVADAALDAVRIAADPGAFAELQTLGLGPHRVERIWQGDPSNHDDPAMGGGGKRRDKSAISAHRAALLSRYSPRLGDTSYYASLPALALMPSFAPTARPPTALRFSPGDEPVPSSAHMDLMAGLTLSDRTADYQVPLELDAKRLPETTRDALLTSQRGLVAALRLVKGRSGAARVLELGLKTARDHPTSIAGADALYQLTAWHEQRGEADLAGQANRHFVRVGTFHPRWAGQAVRQTALDGSAEHRLRHGHRSAMELEERKQLLEQLQRVIARRPSYGREPAVLFQVATHQRAMQQFEVCRQFYRNWSNTRTDTDWRRRASAEAWLLASPTERVAAPPVPALFAMPAVGPIVVDGEFNEPAYQHGRSEVLRATDGTRPPDDRPSRLRVLYDTTYLYVAATLAIAPTDPLPPLQTGPRRRDVLDPEAARFTLLLDVDRDGETGYRIELDAAGNGLDALDDDVSFTIPDRAQSGRPYLQLAQVTRPDAWQIELALPLASLNFQPPRPGEVWGVQCIHERPGRGNEPRLKHVFAPSDERDPTQPHRFGLLIFGR